MARRSTRKLWVVLVLLGLIVAAVYGAVKFFDAVGFLLPGLVALALALAYGLYKSLTHKARLAYLRRRYADEEAVQRIMKRSLWQGQTSDQLVDSLGEPADVDRQVLKTKKKEIWKYVHQGGNRYGLRVTLEDDVVVGWDRKV